MDKELIEAWLIANERLKAEQIAAQSDLKWISSNLHILRSEREDCINDVVLELDDYINNLDRKIGYFLELRRIVLIRQEKGE